MSGQPSVAASERTSDVAAAGTAGETAWTTTMLPGRVRCANVARFIESTPPLTATASERCLCRAAWSRSSIRVSSTFVALQMLPHPAPGSEAFARQIVAFRLHGLHAVGPSDRLHASSIHGRLLPPQDDAALLVQA